MLLSVILPVYNGEKYISRAVKSVLNQTYRNLELICINDGSTDGTNSILDYLKKQDNRMKVINVKNGGVSKARNIGLLLAKGDLVTFIDSDDLIVKEAYENIITAMRESNADACVWELEKMYSSEYQTEDVCNIEYKSIDFQTFIFYMSHYNYSVTGVVNNKMYKKQVLRKVFFNEKIHIWEDMLFNSEAMSKVNKIIYLPVKFYKYNMVNEDSVSVKSKLSVSGFEKLETALVACEEMVKLNENIRGIVFASRGILLMDLLFTMHNLNINDDIKERKYLLDLRKSFPYVVFFDGIDLKHKLTFLITCLNIKLGLLCKKIGLKLMYCYCNKVGL